MVFYKRLAATCGGTSLLVLNRLSGLLWDFLRVHLSTTSILGLGKVVCVCVCVYVCVCARVDS